MKTIRVRNAAAVALACALAFTATDLFAQQLGQKAHQPIGHPEPFNSKNFSVPNAPLPPATP